MRHLRSVQIKKIFAAFSTCRISFLAVEYQFHTKYIEVSENFSLKWCECSDTVQRFGRSK